MENNLKIYKLPSIYSEYLSDCYAKNSSVEHKKKNGQFFTPKTIADFMSSYVSNKKNIISILDPGSGMGILSCSLIESLALKSKIEKISLTLYETDSELIVSLRKVLSFLKLWLNNQKINFDAKLITEDFISSNMDVFTPDSLYKNSEYDTYDYIISNPPYFKIPKSDIKAQVAKELVYGQPNVYSLFLGLSAKLLNNEGEMIFITPRSFAAGNYFQAFRKSFFSDVNISDIHIFESRNKMFKKDKVLQENIIIKAKKEKVDKIKITSSESANDLTHVRTQIFKTKELLDLDSDEKILFIPSNEEEAKTIEIFRKWENTLNDYNINISTGPVVAFRCKDFLVDEPAGDLNIAPLLWLHNIKEMQFDFSIKKNSKPIYIIDNAESRKVLLKNQDYVLIRRFSSKDDKSRLIASPYFASNFTYNRIGIENHLNYLHRPGGTLSEDEIWGISSLFSSKLFDRYFRTFNGNTQVGASELKQIKMPPLESIISIGKKVKKINRHKRINTIDYIINEELIGEKHVQTFGSTENFERIRYAGCTAK